MRVEPVYFADMIHGFVTMGGMIPLPMPDGRIADAFVGSTNRLGARFAN